jgi:hypothetical protein
MSWFECIFSSHCYLGGSFFGVLVTKDRSLLLAEFSAPVHPTVIVCGTFSLVH